jgi:Clp amino terminal domain, pathogenicity island component
MSESPNIGFSRRAFLKLVGLAAAAVTAVVAGFRRLWAADPGKGDSDQRPQGSDDNAAPEPKENIWQRFTLRSRRVVFFAQEVAAQRGENHVATEHLLLGLTRESDTPAARILDRLGIPQARVRREVEAQLVRGPGNLGQDMQLTPPAKRAIDLAIEEARRSGNRYIGTEHLLLGLIGEEEGLGGKVLRQLGADLQRARTILTEMQSGNYGLSRP